MTTDPFVAAVADWIARENLLRPGDRVLAAVSGGADSLALLHSLAALRQTLRLDGLAVASLDHGLRGPAGTADVAFVEGVARGLGLPFHGDRADTRALAREGRLSTEEAARQARYAFLSRVAREWGPGPAGPVRVATGHTADDQAETVLMRIIEGTGPHGLAGMAPLREEDGYVIVRPLLFARRRETLDYCRRLGLQARVDASNRDLRYRRNRVRAELIPFLEGYNPRVVEALVRLADLARREGGFPEAELLVRGPVPAGERPFAGLPVAGETVIHLPRADFMALDERAAARLIREAVARLVGREILRDLGRDGAVRAAAAARRLQVGARLDLPGKVVLEVGYSRLFFAVRATGGPEEAPRPGGAVVAVLGPGRNRLPALGWAINVEVTDGGVSGPGAGRRQFLLDPSRAEFPLAVRTRRPGDAFYPAGLGPAGVGAKKKLKDFFIAAKIPRAERDGWPLVVDAHDRIVWVAGLRGDERFAARPGSARSLRLTAERLR